MKRSSRRKVVFSAAALSVLTAGSVGGRLLFISRPGYGLPYHAQFTPGVEDRWKALGGTWEIAAGSMRNDSNDRGAKLLTGSRHWKDYIVEGDLQLLGTGSVGILARVSDAELGENSYRGYFAGVRTVDNSLVLGAFDFAYHEAARVRMPDPVRPSRWYHIRLKVDGCQITASAWAPGMAKVETEPVNDPDCFRSGGIGLRSNGTGGVWRNVKVLPVDSANATDIAETLPPTDPAALTGAPGASAFPTQSVLSLQYLAPSGSPRASVRGSVVLTRPVVFVQDSTGRGGVEIQSDGPMPLKIGDEIEVTGEVGLDKFSPVIRKAQFHRLAEAVPVSPMVLTVNQVASGAYDGRFVQVEGYLRTISEAKDGTLTLKLDSGTQSFEAILPAGRGRSHLRDLAPRSRLRLRGISVVDARFNKAADPFVILVRSAEDVEVVAGPPWWRPSNLILAGLMALGLIFAFNHLYLLAKHWRLRAVADERERLAHEIHDTLAQSFAGIGFQLQAIRNSMPGDAKLLERQVDRAMLMARTSHEEARRSIASLRPESLGHVGLLPALRECAERMVKNGKVTVETQGEDYSRDLPLHVKDTFFRIGQEAIANSIRHAAPANIRIGLRQQRASLCLCVEDDGDGFIADSDHAGFGLLGMRKRAESISATLVIRSAPGFGTQVEVKAAVGSRFRAIARAVRG
ncbi:MAG TPA: histidine kinase [Bryobacteraceae bacterium]|nr:histidine kinase [Bryobacteraceae bacterium]